ncbi:ABC transporter ATP-binding protein [Microlunatus endophyticus]|uniref:ABC-type quaternary amine transporter n=1 Tax=Microlunatus endophyticus TaxID=1716077 RepID=A0A917W2F5_9ACTN|nr:ABC transporter ATP-binding protein [Microlunatus endophyticus]GGL61226.1 ABC transporter ATP-binding protein [Microlunatus endophyticus]
MSTNSVGEEQQSGLVLRGVGKDLGGRTIVDDLDLVVAKGELVCLLGPSGCGKTTTLRMIAGFLNPDVGTISIDGEIVTRVPPEKRPTAMVFQNYALWPHMSVFENVAYPLKLRRTPKNEITARVHEMLELVNLMHHEKSRPARISGGEQQRVALARALVQRPAVLLLDEPLSNLDAKLRVRVREDIREIQQRLGITTVIVTHDQDEALSISDRVAVMNSGRIEQYSDPTELYRSPATRFVGGFVGAMNTLDGELRGGADSTVAVVGGVTVPVDTPATPGTAAGDRPVSLGVRPENVLLGPVEAGASAKIIRSIPRGHFTEMVIELATATGEPTELRAYLDDRSPIARLGPGDAVGVRLHSVLSYDQDGRLR